MPRIKKSTAEQREQNIIKTFKKALIEKEWSLNHLAELCNMDPGNMSRLINHPLRVKLETVLDVAKKLGIDSIPT